MLSIFYKIYENWYFWYKIIWIFSLNISKFIFFRNKYDNFLSNYYNSHLYWIFWSFFCNIFRFLFDFRTFYIFFLLFSYYFCNISIFYKNTLVFLIFFLLWNINSEIFFVLCIFICKNINFNKLVFYRNLKIYQICYF